VKVVLIIVGLAFIIIALTYQGVSAYLRDQERRRGRGGKEGT
jgi:hypothetical protein